LSTTKSEVRQNVFKAGRARVQSDRNEFTNRMNER
jgi:hypothetical protein